MGVTIKHSNRGFGLTETLVSTFILAIVAAGAVKWAATTTSNLDKNLKLHSRDGVKQNVLSLFWDGVAWENTLADKTNTVFGCLGPDESGDPQNCYGVTGKLIVIRSASNAIFYDSTDDNMGFYLDGKVCGDAKVGSADETETESTEGGSGGGAQVTGNKFCPYMLEASISYVCEPEKCLQPNIKLSGFLRPNPNYPNFKQSNLKAIALETFLKSNDVECGLGCRDIEFTVGPNGKLAIDSPPAKIVLMVDNSYSMSGAQANLSLGMGTMIDTLRGLGANVNFYLLSTTKHRSRGRLPYIRTKSYGLRDDADGLPYIGADCGDYETCTQMEERHLRPPIGDQIYKFKSDFTDSEFQNFKSKLVDRVASVGVRGSSKEEGLCAATHTLFDRGYNKIFDPGDKGGFILISNENDYSGSCKSYSKRERTCSFSDTEYVTQRCYSGNCDYYKYEIDMNEIKTKSTRKVYAHCKHDYSYRYTKNNDGHITSGRRSGTSYPYYRWYDKVESCDGPSSCTSEELARATSKCDSKGDTLHDCGKSYCYDSHSSDECRLRGTDAEAGSNFCTSSFTRDGKNYSSMFDYCQQKNPEAVLESSCSRRGYVRRPKCSTGRWMSQSLPGLEGLDSSDLVGAIHKRASLLLGPKGYFVSAIIHDEQLDPKDCSLSTGSSYGKQFRALTDKRSDVGSVDSICKSDYSGAINFAAKSLLSALASSYVLPDFLNDEYLSKGTIIRDGVTTDLVFDSNLFVNNKTIQFSDGTLQPGDKVKFKLQKRFSRSEHYRVGRIQKKRYKHIRRRRGKRRNYRHSFY